MHKLLKRQIRRTLGSGTDLQQQPDDVRELLERVDAAYVQNDEDRRMLERNWRRFADKWSQGSDVAYGSYDFLGPVMGQRWNARALHVPLADDAAASARVSS